MRDKVIYWVPRVFGIIILLFYCLFALDAGSFIGWLMHMIPSFIILAMLIIAWKWELVGGVSFLVSALVSIWFFGTYENIFSFLLISSPFLIIGTLFIVGWRIKHV